MTVVEFSWTGFYSLLVAHADVSKIPFHNEKEPINPHIFTQIVQSQT